MVALKHGMAWYGMVLYLYGMVWVLGFRLGLVCIYNSHTHIYIYGVCVCVRVMHNTAPDPSFRCVSNAADRAPIPRRLPMSVKTIGCAKGGLT